MTHSDPPAKSKRILSAKAAGKRPLVADDEQNTASKKQSLATNKTDHVAIKLEHCDDDEGLFLQEDEETETVDGDDDVDQRVQLLLNALEDHPISHRNKPRDDLMRGLFMNETDACKSQAKDMLGWADLDLEHIAALPAKKILGMLTEASSAVFAHLDEVTYWNSGSNATPSNSPLYPTTEIGRREVQRKTGLAKLRIAVLELFLMARIGLSWNLDSLSAAIDCDVWYKRLKTDIFPVFKDSADYHLLHRAVAEPKELQFCNYRASAATFVIAEIFKLQRHPEVGQFDGVNKSETCLFYRAMHRADFPAIMEHGLLLDTASTSAPQRNSAPSLKFADHPCIHAYDGLDSAAVDYSDRYMLIAELYLGDSSDKTLPKEMSYYGETLPDKKQNHAKKLSDHTRLPQNCGNRIEMTNQDHIILRYLVKYKRA